ncbi:Oidioi.mRNA.OKI2018_I69.chr1.g3800.t1.cds [Oikopleura dioica]|uniref:Oidioi.mRNA.OKI2018_I69.chr1.g3800.t1.cds n=1 Tax=Oikopleura dioica TaxID=34765 RepID=A0ABN7SZ77_OIKDI|nr:Oidioi.mRNA.OKI2018_I69.chr1.g3800.t1.cds [Oikopleura dioica]
MGADQSSTSKFENCDDVKVVNIAPRISGKDANFLKLELGQLREEITELKALVENKSKKKAKKEVLGSSLDHTTA